MLNKNLKVNNKAKAIIILLSLHISACSLINPKGNLFNPPDIHNSNSGDARALEAQKIPIDDYYRALILAKQTYTGDTTCSNSINCITSAPPEVVDNYVNEGIGLVDSYCLRWFDNLEELQTRVNYQSSNINIIRDLGTALLGLGNANSVIVTAYGAGNTAYTGAAKNFQDTFLLAPNTSSVKPRILEIMSVQANNLREKLDDGSYTFKQAYVDLEKYASICTARTVRDVSEAALKVIPQKNIKMDAISHQISISNEDPNDETISKLDNWLQNGKVDDIDNKRWASLTDWVKMENITDSIPNFITSEKFKEKRQKAIFDLKIQ